MAKRRITYKETYQKDVNYSTERVIGFLQQENAKVFLIDSGEYDDGRDFVTVRIELDRECK